MLHKNRARPTLNTLYKGKCDSLLANRRWLAMITFLYLGRIDNAEYINSCCAAETFPAFRSDGTAIYPHIYLDPQHFSVISKRMGLLHNIGQFPAFFKQLMLFTAQQMVLSSLLSNLPLPLLPYGCTQTFVTI